jgi:hypothetical protein
MLDLEVLDGLDYRRDEPRTRGQHGGLTREEQPVGVVVGDGVDAVRVVAALLEVPEEEVDGRHDLGGIPPAVPVEDVVETFSAEHVARPDAKEVTAGPLLLVAERDRDDVLPLEVVGDRPQIVHGLWHLGDEALVVVDDYLLDLLGNPKDGTVVGGALLGPVVDLPAVVLVRLL